MKCAARACAFFHLLLIGNVALAQSAKNPEDAVVFIEASVESFDPITNSRQLTKVGEGTGFVIHGSGWVITAAHLISFEVPTGARRVLKGALRSRSATQYPLDIIPRGVVSSDVTLLRFPSDLGISFPFLCVQRYPALNLRDEVVAIGFPLGFGLSVRPGRITSTANATGLIQINAGLAPGMSGGPVVGSRGQVIGVIYGGVQGQGSYDFFTPVNLALPLFDAPPASYMENNACGGPATPPPQLRIERSYQISETNDQHSGATPTSREYVINRAADPGYVIVDARLVRTSDTRVSDLTINISPDRRNVEVKFKLTAGPIFDRWRGWLHGQLILTMERAP